MKERAGCAGGGKGPLIQTDLSATLQTSNDQYLFQPIAYSFDSLASNSMKSSNPHSGCRQVEVAKTLDTTDPNPCKNQGGIAVLQPVIIVDSVGGQSERAWEGEIAPTLKASHYKCHPLIGQAAGFCPEQSAKTREIGYQDEIAPTLRADVTPAVVYDARGNGEGDTVSTITGDHENRITDYTNVVVEQEPVYCLQGNGIVRRLTPTECARLQGFADRWGDIEKKSSFTPDEYAFWLAVRNTHAAINGRVVKDYTEAQMLTWYNKLHTDSAEYKMWGNGIALPPALYCMQSMAEVLLAAVEDDWML